MSYEQSNLKLLRPVLGLENNSLCRDVQQELQSQGVAEGHVKFFGHPNQTVNLLTAGEMWMVLREFGLEPDAAELADAADYLNTHLPDSKNSDLTIPTLPVGEYLMAGSQATKLFTIATGDPTILAEKDAAKLLIEEYFGIEDEPGVQDIWPNWEYVAGVWLAKSRSPSAVDKIRGVLHSMPDLLPAQIELGSLTVEVDVNS